MAREGASQFVTFPVKTDHSSKRFEAWLRDGMAKMSQWYGLKKGQLDTIKVLGVRASGGCREWLSPWCGAMPSQLTDRGIAHDLNWR